MNSANEASRLERLGFWARIVCFLLVLRVTLGVVLSYGQYFPPNFYSEFLSGRKGYFFGIYQVAFWVHIVASPLAMCSGTWLISQQLRQRYPSFHRRLGRVHNVAVLLLVAPSGLWMSGYALTGWRAGSAFALASLALLVCAWQGWRAAMLRRFARHQVWMTRCYLLLCSAIVLRVLSGAVSVVGWDSSLITYPIFAWVSSTVPVAVYEVTRHIRVRTGRSYRKRFS